MTIYYQFLAGLWTKSSSHEASSTLTAASIADSIFAPQAQTTSRRRLEELKACQDSSNSLFLSVRECKCGCDCECYGFV
jgi:hypothetical protein